MSFLRAVHRTSRAARLFQRSYAADAKASAAASSSAGAKDAEDAPRSSCPPNTVLIGANYLKNQPAVLALPDEDYPPWLWTILQPQELPDDGPGGKAEKVRLRKENRQRIRDQNFMKTQ
ncbi:hypothetical protein FA95DRAFT_1558750 [Auriscalpium vulgare]|uniref:Uncharacterized protein n=1 Tax=Auriscalpium vulgare TaxID=40419 RepID=A0ACB8RUF2_9AGAM|nr:hypothetical protein FA95DRAFT_1558750 [Auriscalpium vulgare]